MAKGVLHLSIEPELIELAKNSGLNLSQEFEEWIKIRLYKTDAGIKQEDIDLKIAKYRQEIELLQSKQELQKTKEMLQQEQVMVIDGIIDNEINSAKLTGKKIDDWEIIADKRSNGLQYLFKKRFNKILTLIEAKELILNRLKDRDIIKG